MRILTPNANYFLDIHEDIPQEDLADTLKVVKEAWIENVYQINDHDFASPETLGGQAVFVDIGANIGAMSLYVASFNDQRNDSNQIKIYAVEPEPNNLKTLNSNVKNNNKVGQIKLIDKAIAATKGRISISNRGGNSKINREGSTVDAITLDDLFEEYRIDECDVLKMDVEGAEYEILNNASEATLKKIKYLALEFDAVETHTFGVMITKLAELFNLHIIGRPSNGGYIYGRRY